MAIHSSNFDNLYISDYSKGLVYKVDANYNSRPYARTNKEEDKDLYGIRSILVYQNGEDIYTVNRNSNTITRINNGVSLGDIRVGNGPYGICEDPNGVIYVTNYYENTVTVIQNNIADSYNITVGRGPRGIVSDSNGNIWVACYLDNTVVQIVNRTVVKTIEVGEGPEGITCDIQNGIWVACSTSNNVVKIVRGAKILSVQLGTRKRPVALVTDRNMKVYVANYEDDSVSVINGKALNNTTTNMATTVVNLENKCDGPTAISIDSKNNVYVVGTLSGSSVTKIDPNTYATTTIEVCDSPSAFGDFTGCATWNVFNRQGDVVSKGIAENAEDFLNALRPTFKVVAMTETKTACTFEIDSDLVDLSEFDAVSMNGIKQIGSLKYTLSDIGQGTQLEVKGHFQNSTVPITFAKLPFRNLFTIKFGIVDENFENFVYAGEKMVDYNRHDLCACVMSTGVTGVAIYPLCYMVVMIPNRVYRTNKDYLTVNSGFNYANAWVPGENDENIDKIKAAIRANGQCVEDLEYRDVLYNPDIIDNRQANGFITPSLWFFHMYRSDL